MLQKAVHAKKYFSDMVTSFANLKNLYDRDQQEQAETVLQLLVKLVKPPKKDKSYEDSDGELSENDILACLEDS